LGLDLRERDAAGMLQYLAAVTESNRLINLTRISDEDEALRLHLADSLSAVEELSSAPEGSLLDLGSGGGFPGVPLSIQSGRPTLLLDSVRKKMVAVQAIIDHLDLPTSIATTTGRAETYALSHGAEHSAVVARAVAQLPSLVELAAPLLIRGGFFIAMKGRPSARELDAGRRAGEIVGLEEVSVRALTLPRGGEARTIVCFRRCGDSATCVPRRPGLAQHQPLG
jgi:16S rRNA (guanine527-N7)-methyltransferase